MREALRPVCPKCEAVMTPQGVCERCLALEAVRRREEGRAERIRREAMSEYLCVDGCNNVVSREGGTVQDLRGSPPSEETGPAEDDP